MAPNSPEDARAEIEMVMSVAVMTDGGRRGSRDEDLLHRVPESGGQIF